MEAAEEDVRSSRARPRKHPCKDFGCYSECNGTILERTQQRSYMPDSFLEKCWGQMGGKEMN